MKPTPHHGAWLLIVIQYLVIHQEYINYDPTAEKTAIGSVVEGDGFVRR